MKTITVYDVKPNYYFATEDGKVISSYQNKELAVSIDKDGYSRPSLVSKDGKRLRIFVHRLILATFNPVEGWESLQVNHKDGDKLNNNLDNLEWVTSKENIHHSWATGLTRGGQHHGRATMTEAMAIEALHKKKCGQSVASIARELGVGRQAVSKLVNGDTWKYLSQ